MADGRHLGEIEKSSYLGNGLTDFDQIWYGDTVLPSLADHFDTTRKGNATSLPLTAFI